MSPGTGTSRLVKRTVFVAIARFAIGSLISTNCQDVDASDGVVAGCSATQGNQFVVTGRGGLPPTPARMSAGVRVWHDFRELGDRPRARQSVETIPDRPVEVTGWQRDRSGRVHLIAHRQNERRLGDRLPICPTTGRSR
jgi:large exoprotein involved in heme utilization and adhesion